MDLAVESNVEDNVMTILKAACVQLRTGLEPADNISGTLAGVREAADRGASLIATPEMTGFMDIRPGGRRRGAVKEDDDLTLKTLASEAQSRGVWILVGSLAIALDDEDRCANRSFLIAPSGEIAARYDKIHMFDVDVDDGQSYRESHGYRPGDKAVLARTDLAVLGLTICYDVRFPWLYRRLAQAGAQILTCPAAFTQVTGQAHWEVLLRARAIETGSFVIAPAQGGLHEDGRTTYGHSMIISPWGDVLAHADHDAPGVITAEIDLAKVEEARRRIPSLALDSPDQVDIQDAPPTAAAGRVAR